MPPRISQLFVGMATAYDELVLSEVLSEDARDRFNGVPGVSTCP